MTLQPSLSVSVVIPAFNAGAFIEEAILSVKGQSTQPHEIIVVDDESTDGTRAIAASLGAMTLQTGTNGGPAKARNIGIRASTGNIIAFLDADDTWEMNHLEELVALLHSLPDAGIVFGHVRTLGDLTDGRMPRLLEHGTAVQLWPRLAAYNCIPQTAVAVRRDLLLQIGGYDEALRISEDYDLWLRLTRLTKVACTHKTTVNYRRHPSQATYSRRKLFEAQMQVRVKLLRELAAKGDADEASVSLFVLSAWRHLVADAWIAGDRETWEAMLHMSPDIPGSSRAAGRWGLRRPLWPIWSTLKRLRAGARRLSA